MSEPNRHDLEIELLRRKARVDMLTYLHWVWWMPRPLRVGRHTRALCDRLTKAVDDWLDGKSTYLVVNMPQRHGKSDLVSRALPSYFLGRCAAHQPDVIMSGYGTSLVTRFSKQVQKIIASPAYRQLYPGVEIAVDHSAVDDWSIRGSAGNVTAVGIGGSVTGKGGHLIILDDYCKNREEAESKTMRDKNWDSFSDDLMTRCNAPAAIVVVCATRWHVDDIVGRIFDHMNKDPDYPRFESLVFPAKKKGPGGWDILFPELYDEGWYRKQRAQLGSYSASALLDCDPIGDEMKTFKDEWFLRYSTMPERRKMTVYIFVDSANSQKEYSDYTTMWVIGLNEDRNYYVLDGVHDRLNLKQRTDWLFCLHRKWRPDGVYWEQVGAMSDIAHIEITMDEVEHYRFPIHRLNHSGAANNKETRIRALQPLFEAGRILFPTKLIGSTDGKVADLVEDFFEMEYRLFPGSRHDDMIDPLADIADREVVQTVRWPTGAQASERGGVRRARRPGDGLFAR